uniref:RING-type domain-containing protein n=1 Tax=Ascaris lumbricoides TaxID=6252 RepID=A0A0M3IKI9_ASCLU
MKHSKGLRKSRGWNIRCLREEENDVAIMNALDQLKLHLERLKRVQQESNDFILAISDAPCGNFTHSSKVEEQEEQPQCSNSNSATTRILFQTKCIICFNDPAIDPVGCLQCKQLIGCRRCLLQWRYCTDADSVLSRMDPTADMAGDNRRRCPLCRAEWPGDPEVVDWSDFAVAPGARTS